MRALGPFAQGFRGMMPLWVGAVPSGLAFGAAAREAGLTAAQAQLMSLLVFSAPAQMAALGASLDLARPALILAVALAANVHTLLIGLACGRQLRPRPLAAVAAAFLLTEGAYAVASAQRRFTLAGLVGAALSMYVAWNLGTALGALGLDRLVAPSHLGVDFVVTLTFIAVLGRWLRSGDAFCGALAAGLSAALLRAVVPPAFAVLGAAVVGTLAGALVAAEWEERRR